MNFDKNTISVMMALLDDHKDDVKESEYIKICNALKFIHNKLNMIQTDPQPNSERLNYLTTRIAYFDSVINNMGNGRVTNGDKVKTLMCLLDELSILYSHDPYDIIVTTNNRVKELEDLLTNNISRTTLRSKYQTTRNVRVEHEKNQYRARRVDYVRERDNLISYIR